MLQIVGVFCFLLLPCANLLAAGSTDPLPRFEDFGVSEIYRGKLAPAETTSHFAHQYRTVIQQGARQGPNFSGHYTVVIWGCGASCAEFAIVDAITGRTYDPPFNLITWGDGKGLLKK